jgi:hypothetical protein
VDKVALVQDFFAEIEGQNFGGLCKR